MLKLIRMFLILLIIYQIHLFLINGESIVSPSGLLCVLQESNNNLCESNDILQSVDGKIECSVNYGCCPCQLLECISCVELNCNGNQGKYKYYIYLFAICIEYNSYK